MQITNISEAKANLSLLIKTIQETNQPIIIGKEGVPIAVLSTYKENLAPRKLGGSWEGKVKISDDLDKTEDDFINDFYHGAIFPEQR